MHDAIEADAVETVPCTLFRGTELDEPWIEELRDDPNLRHL